MLELLSIAFSLLGLLLLIGGYHEARTLRKTLKTGKVKKAWDKLSLLIGMFIVGYSLFLVNFLVLEASVDTELLVSGIFFLGGFFVLLSARYNKQAFLH